MWHKIVAFVQLAYGDIQTMENNSYSRATTPEQIISAAVYESMRKNISEWKLCHLGYTSNYQKQIYKHVPIGMLEKPGSIYVEYQNSRVYFINEKRDIKVELACRSDSTFSMMTVDGIAISNQSRDRIIRMFKGERGKLERIEQDAKDRLRQMEQAEKAWNLAERLLGMKRNAQGALVPIVDVRKLEEELAMKAMETGKEQRAELVSFNGDTIAFTQAVADKVLNNVPHGKSGVKRKVVRSR